MSATGSSCPAKEGALGVQAEVEEEKKLTENGGKNQRGEEAVGLLQMQAVPALPPRGAEGLDKKLQIRTMIKGKAVSESSQLSNPRHYWDSLF